MIGMPDKPGNEVDEWLDGLPADVRPSFALALVILKFCEGFWSLGQDGGRVSTALLIAAAIADEGMRIDGKSGVEAYSGARAVLRDIGLPDWFEIYSGADEEEQPVEV